MNKLILKSNADKKVIAFTISKLVRERLNKVLIQSDKYNLKRKSDWVNEAILLLKKNNDWKEMVINAEGSGEDFIMDKIHMTFEQRCLFVEIRNEVVVSNPDIRGAQSAIIRAAILGRLIRNL